jgi:hypothetical protein
MTSRAARVCHLGLEGCLLPNCRGGAAKGFQTCRGMLLLLLLLLVVLLFLLSLLLLL